MARNDTTRKGKHLAFLLRHDKEAFKEGRIDKHGWRQVSELAKLGYDRSLLDEIVATNNKQRYEYSVDRRKIRARQGHSIPVDVVLKETTPLDILCHGITTMIPESIFKNGILSGIRHSVHLSPEKRDCRQCWIQTWQAVGHQN